MFFILLFLISWFPTTYGRLQAVCSSGMNVLNDQNAPALIKITGRLSNDSNLQRSCVLKVDKPDSFLRVRAKRNDNSTGFLHIFLYEGGGSALLGHVDVSEPAHVWNTLALCPAPRSGQTLGEKYMSVLGTSGLSFTVEIADSPSEVMLNKPQEANVESDNVMVFRFIPPKGISNTQLDITVTSQSDVPAYLKVSQTCEDVQENIEVIDYKKESLRLSFAKKGRITLSKASVPPLTDSDSSWFIGIALKNATGSVKFSESKYVTLELKKSFDYSYATPICSLFFVSLLGGIIMSIIALLLFKESLVVVNTPNAIVLANTRTSEVNTELGQDRLPAGNNNQGNNNVEMNKCEKFGNFIVAMLKVAYNYWFSGGPKTFSYITGIVGLVLMIGAFQFVFANWYIMIQEGDRDNCYYNDFCYRVTSHDIPFNLMISNLGYIIHGLILFVCVWYMETEQNLYCKSLENFPTTGTSDEQQDILPDHVMVCPNITLHLLEGAVPKHAIGAKEKAKLKAQALKRKYSFSIGYAFAWALLFEGLFSTVYHLCPSRLTFQFDSAFMFIIASLTILLLYNGIEVNECPSSGRAKYPVGALNFFLFVLVPLFIFNYFGILYHSETGLTKALQGLFFTFLIIWWLAVVFLGFV
ncbi:hypothetical protein OS493_036139 [Desmophyllum pertusum]|uniref:Uncharacterized protein n=1 Tax=Desmophyllum pertusum TaxID=174260 RepID=A0A9W9ZWB4_9CNID|nr:hypothetical protein OS493_036139 [Desmophyllum pertusum]